MSFGFYCNSILFEQDQSAVLLFLKIYCNKMATLQNNSFRTIQLEAMQ